DRGGDPRRRAGRDRRRRTLPDVRAARGVHRCGQTVPRGARPGFCCGGWDGTVAGETTMAGVLDGGGVVVGEGATCRGGVTGAGADAACHACAAAARTATVAIAPATAAQGQRAATARGATCSGAAGAGIVPRSLPAPARAGSEVEAATPNALS